jgi:hypothetical protein
METVAGDAMQLGHPGRISNHCLMTLRTSIERRLVTVNAVLVAGHARKLVGPGVQTMTRAALGNRRVTSPAFSLLYRYRTASYSVLTRFFTRDPREETLFRASSFAPLRIRALKMNWCNPVARLAVNIGMTRGLVFHPIPLALVAGDAFVRLDPRFGRFSAATPQRAQQRAPEAQQINGQAAKPPLVSGTPYRH